MVLVSEVFLGDRLGDFEDLLGDLELMVEAAESWCIKVGWGLVGRMGGWVVRDEMKEPTKVWQIQIQKKVCKVGLGEMKNKWKQEC